MTQFRPTSYKRPGEQISTTPSGTKITSAKNLMIDSVTAGADDIIYIFL